MSEQSFGRSFAPDTDIPDLSGKVILLTGGSSGLGKETILQLARHNPKQIFFTARTQSKAERAIAEIQSAVPGSNIAFLQLDLASFTSIAKAAQEFKARSDRLDILINNASVMTVPYSLTEDGYEVQFGINHMGHALLTKLLLPTLLSTARQANTDVRIISLSDMGHMMAPGIEPDQAALENTDTVTRYGHSKLANILFARELQKQYPSITSTSLHPGVNVTQMYATLGSTQTSAYLTLPYARAATRGGLLNDMSDGAKNQLWAATATKDEVRKGYFWTPVGVQSAGSKQAQDAQLAAKLWEWTEAELKKHGH